MDSPYASTGADEQQKVWNGAAGHAWVELQRLLDRMFRPFEELLVKAVDRPGRVLDVGCGAGSTTLAVARGMGAAGTCTGIDISEPMISRARARAEREGSTATFLCDNAQTHAFETAAYDWIISRFGVMFFDNFVEAFLNLRNASAPNAGMRVITWRGPAENPFMTTAERAAAPLLPEMPPRRPDAPGQFALSGAERIQEILRQSGWERIDIRPLNVDCVFPETDLVRYFTRLGPVGLALQNADDRTREKVIETVRAAFDPYVEGGEVRFQAACWMVSAGNAG